MAHKHMFTFREATILTLRSFAIGMALAVAAGVPLGILMGRVRAADRLLGIWVDLFVSAPLTALVPVLIGATWVHAGNGWLFTSPKGGWEYPAFWTVTLVIQALLGEGAFALRGSARTTRLQTA